VRPAQEADARPVHGRLSKRARVYAVVGVACAAAVGAVATIVAVSGGGGNATASPAAALKGRPPLELDLGVRDDPEAVALRKAAALYARGRPGKAAPIFARYQSIPAEVGAALASWPDGSLDKLGELAAAHPHDSLVQLHLGYALYWTGQRDQALSAWRKAKQAQPDTFSAIRADDFLHPYNHGLPTFVPSFSAPKLGSLSPKGQLAELARGRSVHDRLFYGVALQRLGHPISAERVFAAAAARAPDDPDAQVAAAVGRFDKDHPERAFSRLGPLTKRFPHASTVRFHLGLLLLWLAEVKEGKRQLRLAEQVEPGSPLGREARLFLQKLK
jgi:tetratricopeptide (TPR) repeat protein